MSGLGMLNYSAHIPAMWVFIVIAAAPLAPKTAYTHQVPNTIPLAGLAVRAYNP